ncbi:hypothetical protein [Kibdelosporangium phytohabitans]|uniref:Uncharacterized protein n=1 Tax=Kibdelosporangium phytohabitans TaxID=860235 RepID=A0A0N9IB95_9PSEU|nr:hypothetical protein [Kibdelosporangium phytohabitans]ALG12096.1 hypothetical protein AOZ06_39185 [Kibdelosporangium phytohabitans]MBE1463590.1 hypothetical protein [Kibdelosporangium phytohabitans]
MSGAEHGKCMSLWQAAYVWAEAITDAGGRSPYASESVRVLLCYAITVEARHTPGLVPDTGVVEGPEVLASISTVTLMDRQLHTFLDAMLGLLMSHGVQPEPWEPGFAAFQSLRNSALRTPVQSIVGDSGTDWNRVVSAARDMLTRVITLVVTDSMTDVPLALLVIRPSGP